MKYASGWLAVGGAVFSVGALLAISWFIYVRQAHSAFWTWPGAIGIAVGSAGFIMLIIGLLLPAGETSPQQIQRGGDHSRNFQAGRDVYFRDDETGS
jgi:hypothetical protein